MARIQQIQNLISGKLPSYNSAFTKVRGLAFPLDIFLTGTVRFARKLGSLLPIWIPDNATTLAAEASIYQNKLVLTDQISWLVPGSKLRLNKQIFAFVDDIVEDGVFLTENPIINLDTGTEVELFAQPLECAGDYPATPAAPVYQIIIKSDYKIYPGDVLNIGSYEYDISVAFLSNTLEDGRFQYQLTVLQGITTKLELGNSTQVYLRAYPAYESQQLKTPTIPGTLINSVGPFLYDRVSGPFFTDLNVDEIDIVTVYDTAGTELSTSVMNKNSLIYNTSLPPDIFLFWDKSRGSLQWDSSRQAFKAITNDTGVFQLHYNCQPNIPAGQINKWKINLETTVATRMVVELEPNDKQVFELEGGVKTSVEVAFDSTYEDVKHIHIVFYTENNPDSAVYIRSWETDTPTVGSISHATIAKVTGQFVWGSSIAFAKPYWLKLDYLKVQADLMSKFDQGLIAS